MPYATVFYYDYKSIGEQNSSLLDSDTIQMTICILIFVLQSFKKKIILFIKPHCICYELDHKI